MKNVEKGKEYNIPSNRHSSIMHTNWLMLETIINTPISDRCEKMNEHELKNCIAYVCRKTSVVLIAIFSHTCRRLDALKPNSKEIRCTKQSFRCNRPLAQPHS